MIASALPAGIILLVCSAAGLALKGTGDKRRVRCPFHEDRIASAFVRVSKNLFSCSAGCGSLSAKRFSEKLGVPWPLPGFQRDAFRPMPCRGLQHRPELHVDDPHDRAGHAFTAEAATAVWKMCIERSRDDRFVEMDRDAYSYLEYRGLSEAWECGVVGILPPDEGFLVSESIGAAVAVGLRGWWRRGYRIVCPLYDQSGRVQSLQGRNINGSTPKTLNPTGSRASGLAFATPAGLAMLRGEEIGSVAIVGEGLTDSWALSITTTIPAVCAPGVGPAARVVGPWARGRKVLIALDADRAGDAVVNHVAFAVIKNGGTPLRLRWPSDAKDTCDLLKRWGPEKLGREIESLLSVAEKS